MPEKSGWNPPSSAIPIWDGTPPGFQPEFDQPYPTLTPYRVAKNLPSSAVVVLPGGGYTHKAAHEAEPVARWLNTLGISAFVLDYRVAPYRHPIPYLDARRAIQLVRSCASEWAIDPQRVGVLGFSAGGHLASTTGTHFDDPLDPFYASDIAPDRFSSRPDAMILCYPVITFGEHRHQGCVDNLLGLQPQTALLDLLSNEKHVSDQTPPAFVWHTADDPSVPVQNSLLFAQSLAKHNVPFELHIFEHGRHGVGLADGDPYAGPWTELCARWLKNRGF